MKALANSGGESLLHLRTFDFGLSCLHISAQHGHLEVVRALLDFGGVSLLLLKNYTGATCLHFAAGRGKLEVVQALVKDAGTALPALVEADSSRLTCLHAAAIAGHLEVVKFLVRSCRGLIGMRSVSGKTALDLALMAGHMEPARVLLAASQQGRRAVSGRAAALR